MAVFGIDLGTTNSCIAVFRNGRPEVIPVDGESGIVPSVVSLDGGEVLVGRKALNRAVAFPESTVQSVKRRMGETEPIALGERRLLPEDVSAIILSYLAREASRLCGEEVRDVVITVPAYFSDRQRQATREAGEKAGLNVLRLLNEPTAAALFYGRLQDIESGSRILVYDLGGGTFDVSVLAMGAVSEVLASTGDTHLGGNDMDEELATVLAARADADADIDLMGHRPAHVRLATAAEKGRIELSSKAATTFSEPHVPMPGGRTCSLVTDFSREELERLLTPLVERTLASVSTALDEAGLQAADIERVLLVGGVTRMPLVAERIRELFGDARMPVVDPDRCVAMGAAIQGGMLSGEDCERILIDVTPHTLSALAQNSDGNLHCAPIIERNTQIPVTRARTFYTLLHEQRLARIEVYQGESPVPEENTLLGSIDLNLAKAPASCPVTIEYSYDTDGIVVLNAEQRGYGRKVRMRIDSRHPEGMSFDLDRDAGDFEEGDASEAAAPVNFVVSRARAKIATLPESAARKALQALLDRYVAALEDDADDLDELEDELMDRLDDLG